MSENVHDNQRRSKEMGAKSAAVRNSFFDALPNQARIYVVAVLTVGLPLFGYCFYRSLIYPDRRWLYLAVMTIVASCFPVKISLLRSKAQSLTITVSDVFVFSALLLFVSEVAVTLAVIEGLISSIQVKVKRLYKRLFNLAQLALVTFIVGQLYQAMHSSSSTSTEQVNMTAPLAQITVCAALYFVLNSGMIAVAISLATQQSFMELWRKNFAALSLVNIVNGATAGISLGLLRPMKLFAVIAITPIILMLYYARRVTALRLQRGSETDAV